MDIHIFWDGPYLFREVNELVGGKDYGIYQIYGIHQIYGDSSLLYIGKSEKQTFSKRISQHNWIADNQKSDELKIYVGRLAGRIDIEVEEWEKRIVLAESILIHSHQPVYNIMNKQSINEDSIKNVHVFNWGASKRLFPEVSGKRFTSKFDHISEEHIYGEDDEIA